VVQIDDDEDVARVSPEKDELLEAEARCHPGCHAWGVGILLDRMLTAGLGSWMVAVWPLDWRDGRYFRNFQDDHSSLEAVQINSIDFYRNIQKHHENLSFGVPHFMGNFFHDHRTYG
jgi:hypothetical protein